MGHFPSSGSAEAMESGNQLQAGFSPLAVLYELTWGGTGECSSCRAVPEPSLSSPSMAEAEALGSSGALSTLRTRVVLSFVGGSVVL